MMKWINLLPVLLLASGCAATGYSVGVDHGFDTTGDAIYHAPHFTRESEKVDVELQYFRFHDRDDDFMSVDWDYKF